MNELVRNILEIEEKQLLSLLLLLEDQHLAVVKNNIIAMENVIEELISKGLEIEKSEQKRKMIMGDISLKEISVKDKVIEEKLRGIKIILGEINLQKKTNTLLLKQGINFNSKVINILRPYNGHSVYNNIGKINKK